MGGLKFQRAERTQKTMDLLLLTPIGVDQSIEALGEKVALSMGDLPPAPPWTSSTPVYRAALKQLERGKLAYVVGGSVAGTYRRLTAGETVGFSGDLVRRGQRCGRRAQTAAVLAKRYGNLTPAEARNADMIMARAGIMADVDKVAKSNAPSVPKVVISDGSRVTHNPFK
jgi:hypothetical protein